MEKALAYSVMVPSDFEVQLLSFQQALFRFCLFKVRDEEVARDLVQETLARAWEKRASYDPQKPLKPWLFQICHNLMMDRFRKEKIKREGEVYVLPRDPVRSPEERIGEKEKAEMVWQGILELPDVYKEILLLREFEELNYKEISEILHIPLGTVMSRLHQARMLLREKLKPYLGENR